MSNEINPMAFFQEPSVADLRLLACPGAEELTKLIDQHLVEWAKSAGVEKDSFIIPCECPRFQSGDAKGLVRESVRGDDIFIVIDPGNYSVTYNLFGYENHLSPDDHFANLKRLIQAVAGKAHRVSVIMPSLYGGRQHRRVVRESLDCAVALQELQTMGVRNIITFDAHDPRVQNAVPLLSFDNAMPTYQVLKSLLKKNPEISFDKEKFIVVSPDEGAMNRNMYFSSVLGCNLGMFYKRRDYTRVVNGRNPIVAHEYLGDSVEGKTVFIADDIIASGESMLEVAGNLKERGAARIIANATFPLFTSGLKKFDQAVADGKLDYVVGTNLTYRQPELLTRDWYVDVDVSKYAAYFVVALNHDMSVSSIIDPIKKIEALLAKNTLDLLWSNLSAAREKDLPICQDTGMACVFVELGTDVHIDGSFEAAIHEGVRRGYTDGYLRKSIVADPLRRGNTGDNTPAAITVHLVDGDGCTITVAPKGFGSENMSRIQMLKPADGVEGFRKFVLETVQLAGSNPCPPIVLGIGVGGSFDKVAYLAKKALLRPLDVPNPDPYYAGLERELLTAINELGIGPQGFGGQTTCLGLAIEQMPTHVAGLPVAVNVSCHVTRRASARL